MAMSMKEALRIKKLKEAKPNPYYIPEEETEEFLRYLHSQPRKIFQYALLWGPVDTPEKMQTIAELEETPSPIAAMTVALPGAPSREVFVCRIELEELFRIEDKLAEEYENKNLEVTIGEKEWAANAFVKTPSERATVTEDGLALYP
jgi:hypothetical protein